MLEPPPVSSAHAPATVWEEFVQAHDGRVLFQASPASRASAIEVTVMPWNKSATASTTNNFRACSRAKEAWA